MRYPLICAALLCIAVAPAFAGVSITLDDFSSPAVQQNHPNAADGGSASTEVWYDITNDAFASVADDVMPVGGSACLRIDDGGFTNGVYIIYSSVVPATASDWMLSVDMDIIEDAGALNGIQAYEVGVTVNGVHRGANPSDLTVPAASAEYTGPLTAGDDSGNAPETVTVGPFSANAGDDILVAFSTDIGPDYDNFSGAWLTSAVYIDNITLSSVAVPVELSIFGTE